MNELLPNVYASFNSPHFLMAGITFSLIIKFYILYILAPQALRYLATLKPWALISIVLTCSIVGDIAWIVKLARSLVLPSIPYSFLVLIVRLSWATLIIQYQTLAFFIESLTERNYKPNFFGKLRLIVSMFFCIYFLYLAFFDGNLSDYHSRTTALLMPTIFAPLEVKMFRYTVLYLLNFITLPSVYIAMRKMHTAKLPKILKKQLNAFMLGFMAPYLFIEFLIAIHHHIISLHTHTYAIVGISTILLSCAVYYCLRNVIRMRFMHIEPHVQSIHNATFINSFKEVLEQLSHVTNAAEIERTIQHFFKEMYNVSQQRVHLFIRSIHSDVNHNEHTSDYCKTELTVENFMTTHDFNSPLSNFVRTNKILIRDEVEFNNFYQEDDLGKTIIKALDAIGGDIFLPIYQHQTIIAYIIVEEHSRPENFYSIAERDQMVVFASYLSNIINLLQNRNLETLIVHEKELREEIYHKQQELNQYRESIGSFIRNHRHNEIGIIFYKNRKFTYGNQTAKEMIGLNVNIHEGHELTKKLKELATAVLEYKAPQTQIAHDLAGNKLLLSGILNIEQNNVIITVHYPEISDVIRQQINLLKDPTKWDYLLYLETTQSGKLVNQLIPGSGEILLPFKIELFKTALNKKALLLTMADDDIRSVVEIIHHISLRENLESITLSSSHDSTNVAIKIFGINPIFGLKIQQQPLLEKLNGTGTLFIRNIHYLSLEVQEYLAEFIKYGVYRLFKSDQKISSDVRIICSSDQNLGALVQDGKFSPTLFNELKTTTLQMPSLPSLPDCELQALADGFTKQAIRHEEFKHILELSEKDRYKLVSARPTSLQELKMKIEQMLLQKSKKTNIYSETNFDPSFSIKTPDLAHAARLGKHALKDPKVMELLWNTFKNQNRIATFLGVNRSSVNRRCKDYNLQ